jgi:hypothetical protein
MRIIVFIPIFILLFNCSEKNSSDQEKIIGTWTYLKKKKNGKEIINDHGADMKIRYLENGEMIYLTNGNRSGIGFYSYKIVGDSIYRTNVQVEDSGKIDSLNLGGSKFTFSGDTMIIGSTDGIIYYKKDEE